MLYYLVRMLDYLVCRAVIIIKRDHLVLREALLEDLEIADRCPLKPVYRLVIVSHTAYAGILAMRKLKEQVHLRSVCILKLIDHYIGILRLQDPPKLFLLPQCRKREHYHVIIVIPAAVVKEVLVLAVLILLMQLVYCRKGL